LSLSPGEGGARERAAPCRGRQDRLEHAPARLALRVRDWRAQCKALVLVCVATLAGAAVAATPPNTAITNTATASYAVTGTPTTVSGSVTVTTVARTPSTIELMQFVPPSAPQTGATERVNATQCSTSGQAVGPFIALPGPVPLGTTTPLVVPGDHRLVSTAYYHGGEAVFIKLTDLDQNLDPNVAETVITTIRSANGDSETLRLTESGPSTGVFIGFIQSTFATPVANDCRLSVALNTGLTVNYTDAVDGSDSTADGALVDPFGLVFDSSTGQPVNGATVTLIATATGAPAQVLCDDGVTAHPSSVISGAPLAACGATITLPPGGYRFPLAAPGTYRLQIAPPDGYGYPSTVGTPALQALPTAPFAIVAGSRGEPFMLNPGPAVQIDVPLDPASGSLQILKTSLKSVVGVGEFVPYTLAIRNASALAPVRDARIVDRLPAGFRYQRGSARLSGAPLTDPAVSADGRTLTFALGTVAAGATVTLRYVAEVSAGTRPGPAENRAQAAPPIASNVARVAVLVREDLTRSRAILAGRVFEDACTQAARHGEFGLPNVRIVLEDGRYVLTDSEGRWHFDNVRPGTHVVQLDLDSLPAGYEVVPCEDNARFAGRTYSQFVNVRGGSLWRADFYVRKSDATAGDARVPTVTTPVQPQRVEQLPYDEQWLATAEPGLEWLHPKEGFNPAIPAIKVAIKHASSQTLDLRLNGEKVSALNFDGTLKSEARGTALSTWRGVALRDGPNEFDLIVTDGSGQVVREERRTIHYAATPVKVAFNESRSQLAADGRTRPVIAVRFTDQDGRPVRAGVSGEFQINEPYQAFDTLQAIERDPLAGRIGGRPRFEVGEDGTALIELAPTTKAGEVVLTFAFDDRRRYEVRAWLAPAKRDWILVGFVQGTVGYERLAGNLEALQEADAEESLFDGGRVAFYAKGQIKGEYLLTIAYDSAKERGTLDSQALMQAIDPNRFYTLYGDATDPQYDAASIRKLYVRIEKSQFYALFGDFDTGLTVTELARYSRTLNGLKSEYQGSRVAYNAFATMTTQAFVKDELRGDGTSGLYRLSRRNMLVNSDKIRIEARDRFRSDVIVSVRTLSRYLDYDIDYAHGTVRFREPIPSRDEFFNPVYIVADYEAADPGDEEPTYGGRVAVKPIDPVEVGATYVHEGNVGAVGDLAGVDVTIRPDDRTTIKGEYAGSERERLGLDIDGSAWKVEAQRDDKDLSARLYARQQDAGFGLGQQNGSEAGTRKLGADARYRWSESTRIDGQAYRQDVLTNGSQRDLVEGIVQWRHDDLTTSAGLRVVHDRDAFGTHTSSNQALAGIAYEVLDRRLRLRGRLETSIDGEASSVDFPNRLLLGADYRLTAQTSAFAEQEFARGENLSANMSRVGLKTVPWTGAEVLGTVGNEFVNDGTRLFSGLGLTQKWQIDRNWQADFLIDRTQTLKADVVPLNPRVPLASGSLTGDHTAIAIGAGYLNAAWSANGRVEWRNSDTDDKFNLLLGAQRQLDRGRSIAAGFLYTETETDLVRSRKLDGRASYALRPNGGRWIVLDRFDVIDESVDAAIGSLRARKLINNLNANYTPDLQTQWSFQYGSKYVFDRLDGADYSGYTDLMAVEVRRDLGRRFDAGLSAAGLHSWRSDVIDYSAGVSVGYRVMDNTWFAVGYNVTGFKDRDFAGAEYRAKGLYFSIRAKFDQDTLGLNRNASFTKVP
jgi:uncharacterized repeat protein (TIGR01451 family)